MSARRQSSGNFGIGLDAQKPHQSLPNNAARILRPAIFGIDFFSLQNMTPSSTDSGNCFVSAQLPESDYCLSPDNQYNDIELKSQQHVY